MKQSVPRLLGFLVIILSLTAAAAQPLKKEARPYKILTSGRQLTIKSNQSIRHIMVWTLDGHRVVEQKDINQNQVRVDIPVNRNAYYLRIELPGGKVFTERVGI